MSRPRLFKIRGYRPHTWVFKSTHWHITLRLGVEYHPLFSERNGLGNWRYAGKAIAWRVVHL